VGKMGSLESLGRLVDDFGTAGVESLDQVHTETVDAPGVAAFIHHHRTATHEGCR